MFPQIQEIRWFSNLYLAQIQPNLPLESEYSDDPYTYTLGGWGGWPTGNGKKLSSSQAQLGQATCLAVAYLLSISCEANYLRARALYNDK